MLISEKRLEMLCVKHTYLQSVKVNKINVLQIFGNNSSVKQYFATPLFCLTMLKMVTDEFKILVSLIFTKCFHFSVFVNISFMDLSKTRK